MSFKYDKLLGKIKEVCGTQEAFAEQMDINPATVSAKLKNKGFFKQHEILKACDILGIEANKIGEYFFTPIV